MKNIPKAVTFPAYPSIQAVEEPPEGEDTQYIGEVAEKYLKKYATKSESDTMYGLHDRGGKSYIGNKLVIIVNNDIVFSRDEYEGTEGLWELIVSKNPDDTIYTDKDYDNYARLMLKTNTLYHVMIRTAITPKAVRDKNGKKYLKLFGDNRKEYKGKGVVVIPSDPDALLERLDLLLASKKAGHTGVGNELVSICDELKRQSILDLKTYKKLNSIIKNDSR